MGYSQLACGCFTSRKLTINKPQALANSADSLVSTRQTYSLRVQAFRAQPLLYGKKLSSGRQLLQSQQRQKADRRGLVVTAAIFGVGAPEALLVGVVALVVFGPKGLAQAVKSLGATLRTFSPTIRELASVTNELSSTLQEQIGLDEIRNEFRNPPPTYRGPVKAEDVEDTIIPPSDEAEAKAETSVSGRETDQELASKIAQSKELAWKGSAPSDSELGKTTAPLDDPQVKEFAGQVSAKTGKAAADLSLEELEAELKRRREAPKS